jgi:hypothetical protein
MAINMNLKLNVFEKNINVNKHLLSVKGSNFFWYRRRLAAILSILYFVTFFLSFSAVYLYQAVYAIEDFNFAAVGDFGCTSNTDNTVSNIVGKSPEFVFGLADYSYQSTGTCWFNKIGPIDSITKISIGNHEDDSSEGFSGYMSHFGLSQTYYSFNHENAHILVLDTDRNSYSSGSTQYNFALNDLQSASQDPDIDWIIVYFHRPIYTSPSASSASTSFRDPYHPLFDQYGVDLVLQGHNHNYQRTFPLHYNPSSPSNPVVTSTNANNYINPQGAIFAIVGTGGVNFHALSGKASYVVEQQDDFFGQLDVKITDNGNKLEGKFYRNGNNAILDSFSITKGNSAPVANDQTVSASKDTATPITLTATDADNDPLTYSTVTQPQHGTISPPGGLGPAARTYTPNTGYLGPDSFTFTANDGTVDSNEATVSINVVEPGQGGYNYAPSLVLTGSNYNDTPNAGNLQLNQFSVAAWFKTSTNFASDAFIVNKGGVGSDSAGQNLNYGIWMNSAEQIKAGFETSSGADQYVTSVNTYNDGQWHYAVVTNDGSTVRLYIDGQQVGTKSTAGASPETSGTKPVRVGANSRVTPPTNFFTGEVDEVRLWNNGLTAQQVADAFAGNVNTAGQVLYLPFGSNGAPVANNQAVNVIKNTPTQITLTATDPNNDPLTYTAGTPQQGGSLNPAGGPGPATRTYTPPNPNYLGADSFTFTANDGTVNSNVAIVSINVVEPGQGGYNYAPSLVLTGSDYQDTPSSSALQLSQFSVASWFKTSTNFASEAFIVNKGGIGSDSSGNNMNYGISMTSSEVLKAGFETSSGADHFVTSPNTYNDGQWHYAVVTYDGSTVILYIDGQQVGTKSTAGASPESSGTKPVRVGANSRVTPPINFFTGEVDEVRIWNSALTSQEVSNAFAGTFKPGHVLYLDFSSSALTSGYNFDPSLSLSGPGS